jgi:hypothetical protein
MKKLEMGAVAVFLLYALGQLIGKARGSAAPNQQDQGTEVFQDSPTSHNDQVVEQPQIPQPLEKFKMVYADDSENGGLIHVYKDNDFIHVVPEGTNVWERDQVAGAANVRSYYVGAAGWKYVLVPFGAAPIWSAEQYGSYTIPVGARTNVEILTKYDPAQFSTTTRIN